MQKVSGLRLLQSNQSFKDKRLALNLFAKDCTSAKSLKYDYVVVLGDPKYYQCFGIEKASEFGMKNEYGVGDEFMVIQFTVDGELRGSVRYLLEFSVFSV